MRNRILTKRRCYHVRWKVRLSHVLQGPQRIQYPFGPQLILYAWFSYFIFKFECDYTVFLEQDSWAYFSPGGIFESVQYD